MAPRALSVSSARLMLLHVIGLNDQLSVRVQCLPHALSALVLRDESRCRVRKQPAIAAYPRNRQHVQVIASIHHVLRRIVHYTQQLDERG